MSVAACLDGSAQVLPEMPTARNLFGLWGVAGRTLGEDGSPVAADDLDAGPLGEPGRRRVRLLVRHEIERVPCLDVDESRGSSAVAVAERERSQSMGSMEGADTGRRSGAQDEEGRVFDFGGAEIVGVTP